MRTGRASPSSFTSDVGLGRVIACRRQRAALLDVAALVGIAWLWISIYESFTHTGFWLTVDTALGGSATMPGQAAVISTCVLIGWLSIATTCYAAWFVLLRGRLGADFPAARALR